LLDKDNFGEDFFEMVYGKDSAIWLWMQSNYLQNIIRGLPKWLVSLTLPPIAKYNRFRADNRRQIVAVKERLEDPNLKDGRTTIFSELLAADYHGVGAPTTTVDDLLDEANVVLAAASDTTGNAMTIASYHILTNPIVRVNLRRELQNAFPDANARLDFIALEKLPYLTAVIKEALRLSYGVIGRLPRVVPEPGAEFNGFSVPAGTIVGMSAWVMHHDEGVWPDSQTFDPTRWLESEEKFFYLEKYLVPFGKGSRQCIGMPLAYCELYITLGTIFRRFDGLENYETRPEDLVYDDYFSSYHPPEAKKFRVIGGKN